MENPKQPETLERKREKIDPHAMLEALHVLSGNAAARANETITGVPADVNIPGTNPNHDLMDK